MDVDEKFMREALRAARDAGRRGEVPVGAALVLEGRIIARAGNATLARRDPTAHAEVAALRRGARRLGNHRLTGATLYVTLEPCLMCLGAMVQARIHRCVFGARDPKVGASGLLRLPRLRRGLNHRFEIAGGILEGGCAGLLQSFFRERRKGR
jgi:tRNA(adenine34) deaminase